MKRTFYLFIILFTMNNVHSLMAQSYDALWKKVAASEQKDLPQSVIDEATKIYTKAKKEQQLPQMMKAYLTRMQYRSRISSDSLSVDVKALQEWAEQSEKVEEQAILYSILADITPRENRQQAYGYVVRSLQHRERLLQISAQDFLPLVELGSDSKRYKSNNLYDLLARRAIDWLQNNEWNLGNLGEQSYVLPEEIETFQQWVEATLTPASEYDGKVLVMQIYQSLLNGYDSDENRSAWLLTAVDAGQYLEKNFKFYEEDGVYAKLLTHWYEQYKSHSGAAFICAELATYYLEQQKMVDALQWVRKGMQQYPKSECLNRFKNLEQEIIEPSFSVQLSSIYPATESSATLSYKNMRGVVLEFYRLNLPATSSLLKDVTSFSDSELKRYGKLERKQKIDLPTTPDYLPKELPVTIEPLQPGIYLLRAMDRENRHERAATFLYVSSLKIIHRSLPTGEREMVVVDAESGHPVSDAEVVTYTTEDRTLIPLGRYEANKEGVANLGFVENYALTYQVVTPRDSYMPITTLWGAKGNRENFNKKEWNEQIKLFTDRGIYRPGQTIHVGAVIYKQLGDETEVVAGEEVDIRLLDSKNKEISTSKSRSNRYGSFGCSFTLPTTVLPGSFTVQVKKSRNVIKVEEYKHPTFDVKITPPTTGYKAGDSISVFATAKSYSDVAVAHASVTYQIERFGLWRWLGSRASWHGKTVTDNEGNFTIPVKLLLDPSDNKSPWFYNFRITATVTSGAGESQASSYSLPLGKTAWVMVLDGWNESRSKESNSGSSQKEYVKLLEASTQLWKEEVSPLTIKLNNLVGKPISKEVSYQLFELLSSNKKGKLVLQGKTVSNTPFVAEGLDRLASGKYVFVASVIDESNETVTQERTFALLSQTEKRLPFAADSWFCQVGDTFQKDQPATIYVGSSQKDVYLIYDLFAEGKRVDSQRILLSDSIVKFSYPYQAAYGEGVRATFAFVKKGELHSYEGNVVKPQPEKELILTWESFRDKLTPGSQEVWKLKVTHPDGRAADAELMATLYDGSLEALASHRWGSKLRFSRSVSRVSWSEEVRTGGSLSLTYLLKRWKEPTYQFNELWIPSELIRQDRIFVRAASRKIGQMLAEGGEMLGLYAPNAMDKVGVTASMADATGVAEEESLQPLIDVRLLRQNFAETAFFYPALQTDPDGVVTLTFTLPESLTTWKFKGYAHTQAMESGMIEGEAVATKKVMLESHLPRFVRAGDKLEFMATVMNRSEEAVNGVVRMELFQPETNRVVATKKVNFKALASQSVEVPFKVNVANEERVLACRLIAEGNGFSDGEQRYLPVLSDKQWVTETVPFYIDQAGTKRIELNKLFNQSQGGLTNKRLTVEFTANPIWYVVQALPALANPTADNAMEWAAALYASALSGKILNDHPQLKQVIAAMQATGSLNEEGFWSQLQKNGELKGSLWNETPWLKEATDEAEQRRRLSTLIDVNGVAQQQAMAIQQLELLQTAAGSWSWYKGMNGNSSVTQYIAELLIRMELATTTQDKKVEAMLTQAMGYLNSEVVKEYETLKKGDNKREPQLLSSQAVHYLYLCSLDKKWIKSASMHAYLVGKLAAQPSQYSMEEKAMAVVILQAAGEGVKAEELLASILEYSVFTPEMGRYFDTNRTRYTPFDHKIPTQVAVLEAVTRMKGNQQVVNELKRWLLQQKQSQMWGTTVATTQAIYALLQTEGESYALPNKVVLQIGDEQLETSTQKVWGSVKQTIPVTKYTPQALVVTSEKKQLGWGAVYAQYLAPIAEVIGQGSGLHLTRTLLRNGKVVGANDTLEPGDAITVRLTLRADRTIDFVEVKEWRAACFEPQSSHSGHRYAGGIGYYEAIQDASASFYIDRVAKGEYQLEYKVYVTQRGRYQGGISTAQSIYAPQFAGHTSGYVVNVK
ncbi:MAG: alpha-2-macroglobulin family protein [Phocaeicola sp.]